MKKKSILRTAFLLLISSIFITTHAQVGYVWKQLGSGVNGGVGCGLGEYVSVSKFIDGKLYIVVENYSKLTMTVHQWNGTNWSKLPTIQANQYSGPISDIAIFKGEIYLSGRITSITGVKRPGNNNSLGIIRFNGTNWDSLPNYPKFVGADSMYYSGKLCVYKSKLYYTVGSARNKLFSLDTFDNTSLIISHTKVYNGGFMGLDLVDNKLHISGDIDSVMYKGKTSGMFFYDGTNFSLTKSKLKRNILISKNRNDSQFVVLTAADKIELWQKDSLFIDITPSPIKIFNYTTGITFKDQLIIFTDSTVSNYNLDSSKWFKNGNRIRGEIMAVNSYVNRAFIVDCSNFKGGGELTRGAIVNGKLYFDKDSNCSYNAGDQIIPHALVGFDNGLNKYYTLSNDKGNYTITVPEDTLSATYYLPQVKSSIAPCSSINVAATIGSITNNVDIPVHPSLNRNLSVKFNAYRGFKTRRGFTETYVLTGANYSFLNDSLILKLKLPSNVSLVSSDSTPYSNNTNTLVYKFYNLNFNDVRRVKLELSTSINTSKLGDTIGFFASVVNSLADSVIANNYDTLYQKIVASYDPNIKQSYPEGRVTASVKKIKYVIHFQNTGTDTAFKVTVVDTITQKLGLRSLRVTGTSHPSSYHLRVDNKQTLIWDFENIMLPDSHVNEKASHGFIAFETEVNGAMAVGDSINNKAFIYFDYNEAIITNVASVVMTAKAPTNSIKNWQLIENENILLYPNPAQNIVSVNTSNKYNKNCAVLYNSMGQLIAKELIVEGSAKFNVKQLPKGIYFIKIEGTDIATKLVVE